ncbi:hypothetical protein MIV019R [Invertebrate iridescent virus 3]|uniref:Putative Bro-N domain-containing protein 019R n=1 Tax=Invertebrate iridescent virus 3 TaxID=345201 RepID=VF201_IIV3|nr:anti-repressor Ant [Invertebrate iridescent virus 3]Q197E1.1 RecName: Full=Putative Bro-N domain-containing protein 019R [Invertebrate iridescent virus 3]ABF82049.1 hypothetical protein MIV019R [Invertebrate iridescent virus 3]
MNALINLKQSREYTTVTIDGQNHHIKLAGTMDDPYFCGKDVCSILRYKDVKQALQNKVKPKNKKMLSVLVKQDHNAVGVQTTSTRLGSNSPLTYNEGKAIYINEPGLYALIMHSNAPFAEEFQDLVYEQILPSIRKYGSYQLEMQLTQAMEQLSIKERDVQEAHEARIKAERKAVRVDKFMRRIAIKERKLEWIYIATTQQYAQERLFKIGSTSRLNTRIGHYNVGRPAEDSYYYCWVTKCYNSKDIDYHIQKLLVDFKHKNNAELYCSIKFSDLVAIVSFIVQHYDASIDYINSFIKTRLVASFDEEDGIPPAIDIRTSLANQGLVVDQDDIDVLIPQELNDSINEKVKQNLEEIVIERKELISKLADKTNISKKDLWTRIKDLTGWSSSKTVIINGDLNYKIIY